MQYKKIGNTDLEVSAIGLGTWSYGGANWGKVDLRECALALNTALDNGVNFIDTAPSYGEGGSEKFLAKHLKARRSDVILSSKCGIKMDEHYSHALSPADIEKEIEESLLRLNTDYLDLYFCHWPDKAVAIEDSMGALLEIQKKGKIRHIGLSNHPLPLLKRALAIGPVACIQDQYSLLNRRLEKEMIPFCLEQSIGIVAYGALGGGILSGKYKEKPEFGKKDARSMFYQFYKEPFWTEAQNLLLKMKELGETKQYSLSDVALSWANSHEAISSIITGAKNSEQSLANANSGELVLSPDEIALLA